MWAWLKPVGGFLISAGSSFFKKFGSTGVWVSVLSIAGMLTYWFLDNKFKEQKETNQHMLEILNAEENRSKELKRVLDANSKAYDIILTEMVKQNLLNQELNSTLQGIQNVKHTKETIIREATGECLDTNYPDVIYDTFLWGGPEETATGNSD